MPQQPEKPDMRIYGVGLIVLAYLLLAGAVFSADRSFLTTGDALIMLLVCTVSIVVAAIIMSRKVKSTSEARVRWPIYFGDILVVAGICLFTLCFTEHLIHVGRVITSALLIGIGFGVLIVYWVRALSKFPAQKRTGALTLCAVGALLVAIVLTISLHSTVALLLIAAACAALSLPPLLRLES